MIFCLVNYEIQFITSSKNIMVYVLLNPLYEQSFLFSKANLLVTNQCKSISLIGFRASHPS